MVDPVAPHDGDHLHDGDDQDGNAGAVGVHEVEDVLAALGDAGQPQEEACQAEEGGDQALAAPQGGQGVQDTAEDSLHEGELGVEAQQEQHQEEDEAPELRTGQVGERLGVGHEGQALAACSRLD